jgi:hypothetical protein
MAPLALKYKEKNERMLSLGVKENMKFSTDGRICCRCFLLQAVYSLIYLRERKRRA